MKEKELHVESGYQDHQLVYEAENRFNSNDAKGGLKALQGWLAGRTLAQANLHAVKRIVRGGITGGGAETLEAFVKLGIDLRNEKFLDDGKSAISMAVDGDNAKGIKWLADHGHNVDQGDEAWSPLYRACKQRAVHAVRALLEAGASSSGDAGFGPLSVAVHSRSRNWSEAKIVGLLLEAGAAVAESILNERALSPLSLSLQIEDETPFDLILDKVLKLDQKTKQGQLDEALATACALVSGNGPGLNLDYPKEKLDRVIDRLLDMGASPNALTKLGGCSSGQGTALIEGMDCGWIEPDRAFKVFRHLLARGADPLVFDGRGFLAIHIAAMKYDEDAFSAFLKAWPAGLDVTDKEGRTPLMHALNLNRHGLWRMLTQGANWAAKDHNGHDALWHSINSQESLSYEARLKRTHDVQEILALEARVELDKQALPGLAASVPRPRI